MLDEETILKDCKEKESAGVHSYSIVTAGRTVAGKDLDKLTDMLDKLDVSDKHYDRKYQDMQDRLDNLYDKASELEDTIADIDSQINGAYEKQITAKQLYKILANFDRLYYRLTDLEKKEFLRDFIESVEIYPEKLDNGRMLKQINFNFPVYYDGEVGKEIRLLNENTVETVVLMSRVEK